MGLVNTVVPLAELETETVQWCREMLQHSPTALRCLKAALNADCDGQAGLQELAGNATLLFYMTEEGKEGKNAFLEKRKPNFKKFTPPALIDGSDARPSRRRSGRRAWVLAARPATLTAALVPVLVGTAVRAGGGRVQAGAGARGALRRVHASRSARTSPTTSSTTRRAPTPTSASGPTRAVQAGLLTPRQVRAGMLRRLRARASCAGST